MLDCIVSTLPVAFRVNLHQQTSYQIPSFIVV